MTKWTEVNVYTGRPVDEDAPANFGGAGSGVDMNPTGMKKKKRLVDARTKSYKTHRARLEAARVKREAKRNGVQEETLDEAKTPSMIDFHFKKGNENDAEKFVDYLKKDKRKLGVKEIILRPFGAKSGGKSTGSSVSIRLGIIGEIETLHKTLDKMKNRFKFNSSVKVDSSGLQTEEVELDEAMDKKTAIEILKLKKKEDFFSRDGAMIYMSPDERDALKKKVGRLGRDVPGPSKGVSTMIIINNALGKDGTDGNRGDYDTEGKKMINMRKGGKSIGTPKTIGDAMKLAGIREEVERKTFSQKVVESISEFGVESLLAEDNVDVLKSIVKNKAMKPIKLRDGTMKVDLYTASAIVQVLDKINPANKAKLTKMLNGKKSDFMRASEGIMKMIGKKR